MIVSTCRFFFLSVNGVSFRNNRNTFLNLIFLCVFSSHLCFSFLLSCFIHFFSSIFTPFYIISISSIISHFFSFISIFVLSLTLGIYWLHHLQNVKTPTKKRRPGYNTKMLLLIGLQLRNSMEGGVLIHWHYSQSTPALNGNTKKVFLYKSNIPVWNIYIRC